MKKMFCFLALALLFSCNLQQPGIPDKFDYGQTQKDVYINAYFGLKIPFNPEWKVQNKEETKALMKEGQEISVGDDKRLNDAVEASMVNVANLLTVFKYEVGSEEAAFFNPSLMVIAENINNKAAVKTGKDYLNASKKLLRQTQISYNFDKAFYEKKIGDFTFDVMELSVSGEGITVVQEYCATVIHGFALIIIISYADEEQKNELQGFLSATEMKKTDKKRD